MIDDARLAALDEKLGTVVTVDTWRAIEAKAAVTPAAVTDDELAILEAFSGTARADRARTLREKALQPPPPSEPPATLPQPPKVNPKSLEHLATTIVTAIKGAVDGPQVAGKIATLEARIAALESRPQLKWAGIFVDGDTYPECALVTRSGSLWLAQRATATTPGSEGSDWRLVVKSGHVR